jgi:drug/metabolite transporter (DMT)-like permease
VATIDVGIALLFEYLAVPAVAVIALIFFKEKVRARIWVSIGFVIVGLAFVAQVWNSSLNPLGVFYASMAACAYVIYFLLGERALRSMTVMGMIFWALLFSTAFWAIFSEWWIIAVYTAGCISLAYHLAHGFQSAFRTMGVYNNRYTTMLTSIGYAYSIIIALAFILMPISFKMGWIG